MLGRRIGRYKILEALGAGGMGEVFRALDERLAREVALKLLPEGRLADEESRRRFRREARILSQLYHPNVAIVHDFDHDQGRDYIVLELILGVGLDEMLRAGPLPEDEVRRLGAQLAAGLAAAHRQGIVHGDLKPANLRVTPEGRLKILDFGLSRWIEPPPGVSAITVDVKSGDIAGTLHYLAPEQLSGERAGMKTDLYAVGCVLYEMATGRPPFEGSQPHAVMYAIMNETPAPPRSLSPRISGALERLIVQSLSRDPEQRPASATAIQEELVGPRGGPAASPAHRGRLLRWTAAIAAVGIVVAAVATGRLKPMWPGGKTGHGIATLAVLPLDNLSRDAEQEYFADGMTDELITVLSKIRTLRVTGRTSVMRFRGATPSIRDVARTLHVDAVVTGAIAHGGDRVRINAELTRADDDQILWSDGYEGPDRDVLALQSQVAQSIADKIQAQIAPPDRARLRESRTVIPPAYQAYLRGRHAWERSNDAGYREALSDFEESVRLDSTYAPAYVGIANAYWTLSGLSEDSRVVMPKARAAAEHALRLDPDLAEAHAALGNALMDYDWDWTAAEREFRRAVELNPSGADAHRSYAFLLRYLGRPLEDADELDRALAIDPLSEFNAGQNGWPQYFARRYADASRRFALTLAEYPKDPIPHAGLGVSEEALGHFDRALVELDAARRESPEAAAWLAHAYGVAGHTEQARAVLDSLTHGALRQYVQAPDLALACLGLGERERALQYLEAGYAHHDSWMTFLKVDPRFDPVRSDPRFQDLLRRMRFDLGAASPSAAATGAPGERGPGRTPAPARPTPRVAHTALVNFPIGDFPRAR